MAKIVTEQPESSATVANEMSVVAQPHEADAQSARGTQPANWTFLTNHAHVLIVLSQRPSVVLREVALKVGITERAVQRIVQDLEEGGFLIREKIGRQNHYRVNDSLPLRHPVESHRNIGDLLSLVNEAMH